VSKKQQQKFLAVLFIQTVASVGLHCRRRRRHSDEKGIYYFASAQINIKNSFGRIFSNSSSSNCSMKTGILFFMCS
jgi:hypothetical protein